MNMMLEDAITSILESSEVDPIILIQGDHGPRLLIDWNSIDKSCPWEAASILSAYYLPNIDQKSLYASISPVNSFRLIFDMYFGSQFGLLEDKTYFSNFARPFRFEDVTGRSEQPCN
jgi:hypothetical protein